MADKKEEIDISNLSDEEFMNMDPSSFNKTDADDSGSDESGEDKDGSDADDDGADGDGTADDGDDKDSKKADAGDDKKSDDPSNDADGSDANANNGDDADGKDGDDAGDDKKLDTKKAGELTDSQFADIGRQVMGEIKANGTTIKIKSAEDAIQLMQMGANYHKKMQGLKPSMKTLKLLENHGLLDPSKLNYLIDLYQKKPEAITQLLKDSKIDPMDIDLAGEQNYVPAKRTVNDKDMVLDEVLESIQDNKSYNRTLTVLGDEWDDASRNAISAEPAIIRTINAHMESGIYDQVAKAVAYERTLGKMQGVSDFDAYQQVGAYMMENKLFTSNTSDQGDGRNHQNNQHPERKGETPEQIEQRKKRKQGASSSRQTTTTVKEKVDYSPLAVSDEDFIKQNNLSHLL